MILRCLDYLCVSDLLRLCETSRSWCTIAYLKLYISTELVLAPMNPITWSSYIMKAQSGVLAPVQPSESSEGELAIRQQLRECFICSIYYPYQSSYLVS